MEACTPRVGIVAISSCDGSSRQCPLMKPIVESAVLDPLSVEGIAESGEGKARVTPCCELRRCCRYCASVPLEREQQEECRTAADTMSGWKWYLVLLREMREWWEGNDC